MVFRIIHVGLLTIGLIASMSCNRHDDMPDPQCVNTRDTLALQNPYCDWFTEISADYYEDQIVQFHSNNGLSESMDVLKYDALYSEYIIRNELHGEDIDPCVDHQLGSYLVTCSSSMYHFSFDYKLYPYSDGVHICVRDFGSSEFGFVIYDYNLTTNEGSRIVYFRNSNSLSELKPTCEILELNISGQDYNVCKITNTLAVDEGADVDIVAIYLNPDKGVIRFDQKNGVYWEFDGQ